MIAIVNRRNHLSLVVDNSGPLTQEPVDPNSIGFNEDLFDLVDTWLSGIRDFARMADPNELRVMKNANGRYGSLTRPVCVSKAIEEINFFVLDVYSYELKESPSDQSLYCDEPIFEGVSKGEINRFLAGFKEMLTNMEIYSQMRKKHSDDVFISQRDASKKSFADLDSDVQIEIAFQLLEDSLEVYRLIRSTGFDGSAELVGENNPVLFFDTRQISRAVNYILRDRSEIEYQKGIAGRLPVLSDIKALLEEPLQATKRFIGETENYVKGLVQRGNHPSSRNEDAQSFAPKINGNFDPRTRAGGDTQEIPTPALYLVRDLNPST